MYEKCNAAFERKCKWMAHAPKTENSIKCN